MFSETWLAKPELARDQSQFVHLDGASELGHCELYAKITSLTVESEEILHAESKKYCCKEKVSS